MAVGCALGCTGVQVLAGALKDNKRGVVVGSNTFGKGLIQTVVDLSDGSGMAITVARYQTPAGRCAARCAVQLHASCLHACTVRRHRSTCAIACRAVHAAGQRRHVCVSRPEACVPLAALPCRHGHQPRGCHPRHPAGT